MWIPLRSAKMKGFILGFQRRVWCPKWTPASSSWRIDDGGHTDLLRFLPPRIPVGGRRPAGGLAAGSAPSRSGTDPRVCSVPADAGRALDRHGRAAAGGSVAQGSVGPGAWPASLLATSDSARPPAGCSGRIPRWCRTAGAPSDPVSIATRSTRSGRAGSARPSGRTPRPRATRPPRAAAPLACGSPAISSASPKSRPPAAAHLHHDQRRRRPGIDRHQVQLVPAEPACSGPRIVQPAASSRAAASSSPASPMRCAAVDLARSMPHRLPSALTRLTAVPGGMDTSAAAARRARRTNGVRGGAARGRCPGRQRGRPHRAAARRRHDRSDLAGTHRRPGARTASQPSTRRPRSGASPNRRQPGRRPACAAGPGTAPVVRRQAVPRIAFRCSSVA